jgi:DNA repair protein RAD16
MACHPDLVLKSKSSKLALEVTEGNVCRICNDTVSSFVSRIA